MASKASLARLQRVLRQINFPSSVDNPGGLLSSDYVRLAGPLGVFIIDQLDIDVQYKQVFCRFLMAIYDLRSYRPLAATLDRVEAEMPDILALLEILCPLRFSTIQLHVWLHAAEVIRRHGAVQQHWM
jgi:hypothetical protein